MSGNGNGNGTGRWRLAGLTPTSGGSRLGASSVHDNVTFCDTVNACSVEVSTGSTIVPSPPPPPHGEIP